ncbi:phospholipid phosphatase 1-like [Anneissia japonica]|uniref:phospholipid phosphatase 1-like n=1 Tax=Anneissia japonica TaxID=1529436 RepID=UPI00142586C5|nr:phospholipid phosphatase 1-like [Anneissia japonica]
MEKPGSLKLSYKIPLDVLVTILLVLPAAILNLSAKPYQRGFYCDDHSIRYPYKPDTISTTVLILVGGLIPIITIIICERILFIQYQSHEGTRITKYQYEAQRLSPNFQVNGYFVALYKYIGGFIVGGCINQTLTDCSKFIIGRLRPHFLSVCAIDYMQYCPQGFGTFMYIENATCVGDGSVGESKILDARLSFPSGHASFAFYAFMFLFVYLQLKMDWYYMLRTLLQTCCFAFALLTALSRVSDYKHHTGDVIGGGLLGTAVALFTTLYICRLVEVYKRMCVIENHGILLTLAPVPQKDNYGSVEATQSLSQTTTVCIEE